MFRLCPACTKTLRCTTVFSQNSRFEVSMRLVWAECECKIETEGENLFLWGFFMFLLFITFSKTIMTLVCNSRRYIEMPSQFCVCPSVNGTAMLKTTCNGYYLT